MFSLTKLAGGDFLPYQLVGLLTSIFLLWKGVRVKGESFYLFMHILVVKMSPFCDTFVSSFPNSPSDQWRSHVKPWLGHSPVKRFFFFFFFVFFFFLQLAHFKKKFLPPPLQVTMGKTSFPTYMWKVIFLYGRIYRVFYPFSHILAIEVLGHLWRSYFF